MKNNNKFLHTLVICTLLFSLFSPALVLADDIPGTTGNDILTGTDGPDNIYGYEGRDTLNGLGGDDNLFGGSGKDTLNGDAGNDSLYGEGGVDTLNGGEGDDLLNGGAGGDTLNGDGGTDTVEANLSGNQNLELGEDYLSIYIDESDFSEVDTLSSIEKAILTGSNGDNEMDASGFKGTVTMDGGDGNDILIGGEGDDFLEGGEGRDDLYGGPGQDTVIQTVDGNMTLSNDKLTGLGKDYLDSIENAILTGGKNDNTIDARDFTGDTLINGMGGDDTLLGGSGDDILIGGSGNDYLFGGDGNDLLIDHAMSLEENEGEGDNPMMKVAIVAPSEFGDDHLVGGKGDDILITLGGNDTLEGGKGNDTMVFEGTDTGIHVDAFGNEGKNTFCFAPGTQGYYSLYTSSGKDTLNFSEYDQSIKIDLSKQAEQQKVSDGLWITLFGMFKKLIGTNQNDVLVGNDLNNTIKGLGGDDSLDGGAGINKLNGGDGIDTELNKQETNKRISIELPLDPTIEPTVEPTKVPDGETKKDVIEGTGGFFIPVTGGLTQKLACPAGSNEIVLTMDSGDQVRFIGLCDLDAVLDKVPEESLPGSIPAGTTFVSDLQINVLEDGKLLELFTSGSIEISFAVPQAFQGKNLALMFWDTESLSWMEIPLDSTDLQYPLNLSDEPSDPRLVLKGLSPTVVRAMTQGNFSGLFVLVAK